MKSTIARCLWLICLIAALTGPNLLSDSNDQWKKFDRDGQHRESDREKGHGREDRDYQQGNHWMDDHRDNHDRRDMERHIKPERTYFDSDDRRYLHNYYEHNDRHYWVSHNPPPGLLKHLKRHHQLPPEMRAYLVPFPVVVERELCPLPPNYLRFVVGGKGLIVDAQFNIVDLFDLH